MSTEPDVTREERPSIVGSDKGPESPYPIKMFGIIERGFGRGSKELGIPTANLPRSSIAPLEQLSSTGIYFGFAKLHPTASSSSSTSQPTQPPTSTSTSSRSQDSLSVDTISHLPGKTASYPQAQVDGVENDKPQQTNPDHPTSLRDQDYAVWPMVMSVGYNPYYGNKEMTAEVHIMHDFPTSFYGHPLSVILLGYIRPELNYVSKEKLIEDINTDVRVALKSLAREEWAKFADVKGFGMEGDVVKEVAEQVRGLSVEGDKKEEQEETKESKEEEISIKLEFGGGLHLLFSSTPKHTAKLPKTIPGTSSPVDVRYLIKWMKENILSERVEMFGDGEGVRPGILVLVNDTDWELEGELDYQLQAGDEVVFISTLHGG